MKKILNSFFVSAVLAFAPKFASACGGDGLWAGAWTGTVTTASLWLFISGVAVGLIGMTYGLALYIVQYFSKDKNKVIFKNKKRFVIWFPTLFVLSLLAFMLTMLSRPALCATSTSF